MIINLTDTNSAEISSAMLRARRSAGSPAMGMVLTLIIVCAESDYAEVLDASRAAGHEHPSRILVVVAGTARKPSLNAQVRISEGVTGEVVIIRMRGAVARHPASVIRPLLLPDSPVVVWWPHAAPANPAGDEIGQMASRRITDASSMARPLSALEVRAANYAEGDTDLSWTRLTPWRALLAAALDQYPAKIKSAAVQAEGSNGSACLLAAWLQNRLKVDVTVVPSDGPGITAVRMATAAGDIAITRPDGLLASYTVPGQPNRLVALKRREIPGLLTEELRRMDADDIFETALQTFRKHRRKPTAAATKSPATKTGAKKTGAKKATADKPVGKKAATKRTGTKRTGTKRTGTKRTGAKKAPAQKAPTGTPSA